MADRAVAEMARNRPGESDAASGSVALAIRGLTVRLRGRAVLDRVTLDAEHGAVTALLGPNGAGKTTLLRATLGLLSRATSGAEVSGDIVIDGASLDTLSRHERARRVAYLPQRSSLDAPLAVVDVIAHGRYAHSLARSRSRGLIGQSRKSSQRDDDLAIEQAMVATDIVELARRPFTELSGGEQRRVLLARALATGARILVLDEPAASLDISHSLALYRLLGQLAADGYCVVIAMHDLNHAIDYTTAAVLLDGGSVVASGATAEVVSDEFIGPVYGVELSRRSRLCFALPGTTADSGSDSDSDPEDGA